MSSAATSPTRATAPRITSSWPAKTVELVVGEREAGQAGEVGDVVAGDPTRICSHDLSSDDFCGTFRRDIGRERRPAFKFRRARLLPLHAVYPNRAIGDRPGRALAATTFALTQSPIGA